MTLDKHGEENIHGNQAPSTPCIALLKSKTKKRL